MVIGLKIRALNKLAYLFYLKRIKRNKKGNSLTDWQKANAFLDFCKNRPNLIKRIMK